MAEYRRDWNAKNPGYQRAAKKKWEAEHPEEVRAAKRRRYQAHLERSREQQREWRRRNPEKMAERRARNREKAKAEGRYLVYRLRAKYGLSIDDLQAMVARQKGCCAICERTFDGTTVRVNIDHCHETGAVRGLLCNSCNHALGLMLDDPARLKAAGRYLDRALLQLRA